MTRPAKRLGYTFTAQTQPTKNSSALVLPKKNPRGAIGSFGKNHSRGWFRMSRKLIQARGNRGSDDGENRMGDGEDNRRGDGNATHKIPYRPL